MHAWTGLLATKSWQTSRASEQNEWYSWKNNSLTFKSRFIYKVFNWKLNQPKRSILNKMLNYWNLWKLIWIANKCSNGEYSYVHTLWWMIYEADEHPDQRIANHWKGGSYACQYILNACFELLASNIVDYFLVPTG
jgi:hypothetical protein